MVSAKASQAQNYSKNLLFIRIWIKNIFYGEVKKQYFDYFCSFIVSKDWAIWMLLISYDAVLLILLSPPTGSSVSFTHSLTLCLTGAFSALLEFVNCQNAAPGWLAKCVWFFFVEEHALGTLERNRDCVRETERGKKINKLKRLIEGKRMEGRAGWALKRYSLQCVPFPSTEAGSLCAASVGRQRRKERRPYEGKRRPETTVVMEAK